MRVNSKTTSARGNLERMANFLQLNSPFRRIGKGWELAFKIQGMWLSKIISFFTTKKWY